MKPVKTLETSRNVWIIDKAFYMPQLDRYRRVWLYLPEEYTTSRRAYPVVYMQDGQNLFEGWSAFTEEWGVDETMDALKGKCIIVAVDNGQDTRINEYSFYDNQHGRGEGRQYLEFLVYSLKPYIDKTYRTLPDRENTYIAGSSMGGLISFYAALYFPEYFGGAGVLSPSFWLAPNISEEVSQVANGNNTFKQRLFFYAGSKEGEDLANNVRTMVEQLKQYKQYAAELVIDPRGEHAERAWRKQFSRFYKWIVKKPRLIKERVQ